jgi:basic membrane protein A
MATRRSGFPAIAVAILLVLAVLAGCVAPPAAPPPATGEAPQEPAAAAPAAPEAQAKVALLMAVACDDSGWGTPACEGLKKAEQDYGVEISISERVPIPDAETAMRDYAERGYNLIIGHGFQFGDAAATVSKDYPQTMFAVYAGVTTGDNLAAYDPKNHENGYLAGVVAGSMTKTKKIGAVGGMDIPAVVRLLEGYCQGAKSVDPAIECLYTYTNSWDDIQKGKEAATAMIDTGADVFFHDASLVGVGMIQAAGENNAYAIGFGTCQDSVAPNAVLTSAIDGIGETMILMIQSYLDGTLERGMVRPGTTEGIFSMCPYSESVPQAVIDKVVEARQAIGKGDIVVEEVLTPSNQ